MEDIYKKGTVEGMWQGYLQAKREMEGRMRELESKVEKLGAMELEVENLRAQVLEVESLRSRLKTAEDQINLLGRLNKLTKDET